jgi:hypothetical protein
MFDRAAVRAALLQDLTIEMTRAEDAQGAASAVVRLGRALLDGISGVLWLVEPDGGLSLAASDGVPESFLATWRRVRADATDLPALKAVQQGKQLWIASMDEYREVASDIAERAEKANRPLAFCALPLAIEGRTLGVIVFGFVAPHPFPDDEKKLALAIAGHAAQALDRARLQSAQWRALAGLRTLAKAGEMLASSLDVDETLTALAKAVVPDVADWCAVDLLTSTNVRRLTAHHSDPSKVELARAYAERSPERHLDARRRRLRLARDASQDRLEWRPRAEVGGSDGVRPSRGLRRSAASWVRSLPLQAGRARDADRHAGPRGSRFGRLAIVSGTRARGPPGPALRESAARAPRPVRSA